MKDANREQDCRTPQEATEVPDVYQLVALVLAMTALYMQSEELGWLALWFVFGSFATMHKSTADYRQLLSSMLFSVFSIFQARRLKASDHQY